MYIYICTYIYTHVFIHSCIYVHTHVCIYTLVILEAPTVSLESSAAEGLPSCLRRLGGLLGWVPDVSILSSTQYLEAHGAWELLISGLIKPRIIVALTVLK